MNAREVAKGLSKAQREAFDHGSRIGCRARIDVGAALKRKGLAVDGPGSNIFDWTPLGVSVRRVLEENERG